MLVVLLLMLAAGALAFAMSLEAGLSSLGARAAASAAAARPAAGLALRSAVLTVAATPEAFSSGPGTVSLAPIGDTTLEVEVVPLSLVPRRFSVAVSARVGSAVADAVAVFDVLDTDGFRMLDVQSWREP